MTNTEIAFRRKIVLWCGVFLYFFASMSKVLVPGTIYNELQTSFDFDATHLAWLGAGLMYSYAASQFVFGIFSDRYGGARLLLGSVLIFGVGSLVSVSATNFLLLLLGRVLVGFGAGCVYVGVAKLVAELYRDNFLWVMTGVLVVGFLGPVCGGLPMARLTMATSWRWALAVPAVAAVIAVASIAIYTRGTLLPVKSGNQFDALKKLFCRFDNVALFWSVSVICGAHYTIAALIGKKCLEDTGCFTATAAAAWITVMLGIVAIDNIVGNVVLKLLGDCRKKLLLSGTAASFAGGLCGVLYFALGGNVGWLIAGLVLIAIPAGFFPVYCTIAKELNPPENVGLALAMLNFLSFLLIALEQQLSGVVLKYYEKLHPGVDNVYSGTAYCGVFFLLALFSLSGIAMAFFVPETKPRKSLTEK